VSALRWISRPSLDEPVLIAAFEGWTDAGGAATGAATHLLGNPGRDAFAEVDPEEFFDFTVRRPHVRVEEGYSRLIVWPANQLYASKSSSGADLVVLVGIEPHLKWRTFTDCVVEVAHELNVRAAFTLGAMLADVAHTRPVPVRGSSADREMARKYGLQLPRYQGPTGVVGVLQDAFAKADIPVASLMAQVPHYVPAVPSPKAKLALVEKVRSLLGLQVDTTELEREVPDYVQQVDEAVAADEDVSAYVRTLESRSEDSPPLQELPDFVSGDEIAAQLEQFLREQDDSSD
jgi:predicted ATP-grasp superfamily ATP-dependent carboligase